MESSDRRWGLRKHVSTFSDWQSVVLLGYPVPASMDLLCPQLSDGSSSPRGMGWRLLLPTRAHLIVGCFSFSLWPDSSCSPASLPLFQGFNPPGLPFPLDPSLHTHIHTHTTHLCPYLFITPHPKEGSCRLPLSAEFCLSPGRRKILYVLVPTGKM